MTNNLIFEYSNGEIEKVGLYNITEKYHFFYNEYFQAIFKKIRENKQKKTKNQVKIYCDCNRAKKLELFVSSLPKKKKFYLKNAQFTANEHDESCIFYNDKIKEDLVSADGSYSEKILLQAVVSSQNTSKDEIIIKENHRKKTFNNFCFDLLIDSNSFAINRKNKLTDLSDIKNLYNNLKMPDFRMFCSFLSSSFMKSNLYFSSSVFNTIKKNNLKIQFGIIEDEIFIDNYIKDNRYKYDSIKLNMLSFNSTTKELNKISLYISYKKLLNSSNLVKIHTNYIKPPYFVIAVMDKYNKVVRIFIQAINFTTMDRPYAFVESNYERDLSQKYIDEKKYFIKPILGDIEYAQISSKIAGLISKSGERFKFKNNRPDFIMFYSKDNKNFIDIIELSGFKDEVYLSNLRAKIAKYNACITKQNVNATVKVIEY